VKRHGKQERREGQAGMERGREWKRKGKGKLGKI